MGTFSVLFQRRLPEHKRNAANYLFCLFQLTITPKGYEQNSLQFLKQILKYKVSVQRNLPFSTSLATKCKISAAICNVTKENRLHLPPLERHRLLKVRWPVRFWSLLVWIAGWRSNNNTKKREYWLAIFHAVVDNLHKHAGAQTDLWSSSRATVSP